MGREDEALEYLKRAEEINFGLADPVIEVENLAYQSMVYLATGEIEIALEYSKRAVALLEVGGTPEYPQVIYFNHSKVLSAQGLEEEAKRYLEKAHDEVIKRGNKVKDKGMKESFHKNVRMNREIVEEWLRS